MISEDTRIVINKVDYISIGRYMEYNDGILHYIPCSSEKAEDWIDFLNSEEPIIILWSLSYLQNNKYFSTYASEGEMEKLLIESGGETLTLFLKKYCWQDVLDDMFVDFIFGRYSCYGDEEFPEIIYNGNVLEGDYFDFGDHVFIESSRFDEFIKELSDLIDLIIKSISN